MGSPASPFIQAVFGNVVQDRRGNEIADRLPTSDPFSYFARRNLNFGHIAYGHGFQDTLRCLSWLEPGTSHDDDVRNPGDHLRVLPHMEFRNVVHPDHEKESIGRMPQAKLFQSVHSVGNPSS